MGDLAATDPPSLPSRPARVAAALFEPVDIAPLVLLRIAFGAVLLVEVVRFFRNGWIGEYFGEPHFFFKYPGFAWVEPLPLPWMRALFQALGVLAVMIAAGLFYRVAAALFFLGFTFVFLVDRSSYLNHFYLISLVSLVLVFLPANRALSLDAWARPAIRSSTVPAWTVWLARLQIGIPYFYGGLAKLDADWLLRAEPMRRWLAARADFPVLGRFFHEPWMAYAVSWGGLLVDLGVVPLLLWRRTRWLGLALAAVFHLMNHGLFQIGIFPWFMLATLAVFFPPGSLRPSFWKADPPAAAPALTGGRRAILAALALWAAFHVLFPLRHLAYAGPVSWTEEGHEFAWHMMLRSKQARTTFIVTDLDTGGEREVRLRECLTGRQARRAGSRPELIRQLAHHLAAEARAAGVKRVSVRARALVSLNGRPEAPIVDEKVDLAAEGETWWGAAPWIQPMPEYPAHQVKPTESR